MPPPDEAMQTTENKTPSTKTSGSVAKLGHWTRPTARSRTTWLVSYADLVTILLSFLILLLAVSGLNQPKFELLVSALSGRAEGTLQQIKTHLDEIIEESGLVGEVETLLEPDGLKVSFPNALLFDSGSARLTPQGVAVFEPIASQLTETVAPRFGFIIEGHTDDVPIHTVEFQSNWELSASRAIHVMNRLSEAGVDPRRISIQGYADTRPAEPRETVALDGLDEIQARRAASRRVIIRIDTLDDAGKRLLMEQWEPETHFLDQEAQP